MDVRKETRLAFSLSVERLHKDKQTNRTLPMISIVLTED